MEFCFLVFGCQYQCNQLPGKTLLRNDLSSVEWDVSFKKPYSLSHSVNNTLLQTHRNRFCYYKWTHLLLLLLFSFSFSSDTWFCRKLRLVVSACFNVRTYVSLYNVHRTSATSTVEAALTDRFDNALSNVWQIMYKYKYHISYIWNWKSRRLSRWPLACLTGALVALSL